ncbi:MAG: hypothetical protein ABIO91_02540 [Pyrinomonadaceae bacterium]
MNRGGSKKGRNCITCVRYTQALRLSGKSKAGDITGYGHRSRFKYELLMLDGNENTLIGMPF